ncbi:hypothetical protein ACFT4A_32700 [Streptomyces sp. NPDC057099]|uniref:hypothetical protein n=1 Tax=Streptomyces sp. NPDC057099 TaxID=3346019 RepID=UPI003632E4E2
MIRTTARPARWRAYAVGCVAALGIAAAAVPAAAASAVDGNGRYTAEEIHTFLEDFYGEHGPGDFARKYGISPQLKEKVADNPEFDVLLCAQNVPASIDIGPVTTAQSARVGWATVSTYWNGGSGKADFTAYVDLDATRPIQLLDVDCGSGS